MREIVCEACGESFGCGVDTGSCWCAARTLSPEALVELEGRFSDCLCPSCLAAIARDGRLPDLPVAEQRP